MVDGSSSIDWIDNWIFSQHSFFAVRLCGPGHIGPHVHARLLVGIFYLSLLHFIPNDRGVCVHVSQVIPKALNFDSQGIPMSEEF